MPTDPGGALSHHQNQENDRDRKASIDCASKREGPDAAATLHNSGLTELRRGQTDRAAALLGQAVALRPDDASYRLSLAEAFWALRRLDRAVEQGQIALRLQPESLEAHCNLGATLLELGDADAAIGHFSEALRLQPGFVPARINLGSALERKGEKIAALAHYREAARLDPDVAETRANLGKLLLELNQPREALIHCQEAVRLRPRFPAALVNLGNVLLSLGRIDEAAASFREAIRIQPRMAAAHGALSSLLEQIGDLDQAIASLRETIRHDPRHAGALARLATRLGDQLSEADRLVIEARLADPGLSAEQRWTLQFGLAHALDAHGDCERAAELTIKANAAQLASFRKLGRGYDPQAHRAYVDQLIAAFNPDLFARARGFGLESERPIFIVGLPRSGTTLVEQVLASHPRVFGAGELRLAQEAWGALPEAVGMTAPPQSCLERLDRDAARRLADRYLKDLEALGGSADRIIDKMPENALYLGWIAILFPNAKLIHCRRDPRDVAFSCWMTHFERVRWACDPDSILARIRDHQRLMDHWRRVLPTPILDVDYEAIVDDLESEARVMCDWCGLEWDPQCLEFHKTKRPVRTASAAQVRRPIYRKSVGRWKPYERALPRLFPPQS